MTHSPPLKAEKVQFQKIDFLHRRRETTETCPIPTFNDALSHDVLTFFDFDPLSVELMKSPL